MKCPCCSGEYCRIRKGACVSRDGNLSDILLLDQYFCNGCGHTGYMEPEDVWEVGTVEDMVTVSDIEWNRLKGL